METSLDEGVKDASKVIGMPRQYSKTLDGLLEGIQIIDFNWLYVYVNDTMAEYEETTKEKLLGHFVLERYIEHPGVFDALLQCMTERRKKQIEMEFVYSDQSKRWLELNMEPVEEGILVLSLDITKRKDADEKIRKANHLYSFISQVNQNIVRVKDESTLFRNACRMALEFGKFKMAWIGKFDDGNQKITLVEQSGIPSEEIKLFSDAPLQSTGPQDYVLRFGTHYICNDIEHDFQLETWKPYAAKHGIRSCMVLPLRKSDKIIGTLNLYSTELYFSATEEIAMLVEVTKDISFALDLFEKENAHKSAEALVIKNEKQFRHTLDNMLEGIQIHDFNWRYIYVNDALVNYSTYSRQNLLGYTIMEKYPGIEQTPLFNAMQLCMNERETKHFETEFVFPDGTKAQFEISIQPIPEGIFILSVNRSEQKRAKEKLLKVNRLYAFISAINQSIVHISDQQVLLNNACNIAADIGQFEVAWIDMADEKRGILNRVCGNDKQAAEKASQINSEIDYNSPAFQATPTGIVFSSGRYLIRSDLRDDPAMSPWKEQLIQYEIKTSILLPIKKFGKVVGVFNLHSAIENFFDEEEISLLNEATGDISFALENFEKAEKHRVADANLICNNEELQKTNSELDRFVYSASHDLRAPLCSVLGLVTLIESESKESNTLLHTKLIRDSINRLDGFIKNILSYSKNNRLALETFRIPLRKMIRDSVNSFRHMNEAVGIYFEIDINEQQPFYSDPHRFNIVIENLISNAVKFQDYTRARRFIKITGKSDAANLTLQINDNGIGIAPEYRSRIYDMFFRIHGEKAGSGIGLYIVKETIAKLQGSIQVDSKEHVGTTFIICLKNFAPKEIAREPLLKYEPI